MQEDGCVCGKWESTMKEDDAYLKAVVAFTQN